MDLTAAWRSAFESWPECLPRSGSLVANGDTVPFSNFLIGGSFVVLERDKPDSQGARKLIVALAAITAVKLTLPDALETLEAFTARPAAPEDEFGLPPEIASRAAAAVRRTGDATRRR